MESSHTPLKRKLNQDAVDSDTLTFTPLGSGREVGRSCHVLRIRGKTIMLDCGVHPAYSGAESLPLLDKVNIEEIDLVLISHFHLDHAAGLPYQMKDRRFKGRVFMTHPTKSIYKLILQDFVKVTSASVKDSLYTEAELLASMDRIEVINYHQVVVHKGVRFWPYHAGHVLGAVMFMVEVGDTRVLYTGDYSRTEDRHLMAAEVPEVHPDVLVVEATHGTQHHHPPAVRERLFMEFIHKVVIGGGKCLIPQFALGRAQELLLILDEYWQTHPELQDVPIYYASSLANRCLRVYQSYTSMMNAEIQKKTQIRNPFNFKHVIALKSMTHFDSTQPAVVMASPGMLQNGLSRQLLEEWCSDHRNGVMIAGYCVEGTLAYSLQTGRPTSITATHGESLPLELQVSSVPFTAHADCRETCDFVRTLAAPHVILVHGNSKEMGSLEKKQTELNADRATHVYSPRNGEDIEVSFAAQKHVRTAGDVFDEGEHDGGVKPGSVVQGLLIQKDFQLQIMKNTDVRRFTKLYATPVRQRMTVPFSQSFSTARLLVSQMFHIVDEQAFVQGSKSNQQFILPSMVVMGVVTVTAVNSETLNVLSTATTVNREGCAAPQAMEARCEGLRLTWKCDVLADMVADALITLLVAVEGTPGAAKMVSAGSTGCTHHSHDEGTHEPHDHSVVCNNLSHYELERLVWTLDTSFGTKPVTAPPKEEKSNEMDQISKELGLEDCFIPAAPPATSSSLGNEILLVHTDNHSACHISFLINGREGILFLADLYVHMMGPADAVSKELRDCVYDLTIGYILASSRINASYIGMSASTKAYLEQHSLLELETTLEEDNPSAVTAISVETFSDDDADEADNDDDMDSVKLQLQFHE